MNKHNARWNALFNKSKKRTRHRRKMNYRDVPIKVLVLVSDECKTCQNKHCITCSLMLKETKYALR